MKTTPATLRRWRRRQVVRTMGLASPCPTRECVNGSKKRSQAVAEAGVVHPPGERRIRGRHGGRAGYLCACEKIPSPVVALTKPPPQLLAGDSAPTPPEPGRTPLRQDYEYRREGTRNRFLGLRYAGRVAPVAVSERRCHAAHFAHRCAGYVDEGLPGVPGGPGGPGQPEHPPNGVLVTRKLHIRPRSPGLYGY